MDTLSIYLLVALGAWSIRGVRLWTALAWPYHLGSMIGVAFRLFSIDGSESLAREEGFIELVRELRALAGKEE